MDKRIGIISACAHRLYLYRPELFDLLRDAGYSVSVFGPEPQALGDEWLSPAGLRYTELPLQRRRTDPFAEARATKLLAEAAKAEGFGLLYSYGIRFAPLVNNAARRVGIPCISVINGAGSLFITEGAVGDLKRRIILPYIRRSLRYASKVVFQNMDDLSMFSDLRLVKEEQTITVHGSGVNPDRFPASPLPKERVFGFCSRMNPEKGIDELLRAFEQVLTEYPDAKLRLAGEMDGIQGTPTAASLQELCKSGAVEYLGEISDVPSFLKTLRCFVFPSYREGTPRAVLEAMSCGRPIITTDAVGCRETVTDGYNGLLVKPRDVRSLSDAMLRFCADEEIAGYMGENARKVAETKFNVYEVNRALLTEIQKQY